MNKPAHRKKSTKHSRNRASWTSLARKTTIHIHTTMLHTLHITTHLTNSVTIWPLLFSLSLSAVFSSSGCSFSQQLSVSALSVQLYRLDARANRANGAPIYSRNYDRFEWSCVCTGLLACWQRPVVFDVNALWHDTGILPHLMCCVRADRQLLGICSFFLSCGFWMSLTFFYYVMFP